MKWSYRIELSSEEKLVSARLKRIGRFYLFLREIRHELFDKAFQTELEKAYERPGGEKALPAALLAMVTLLQAYDQVGDADAVVTVTMDKRWQLVLDCLGAEHSPFSQGVLSQFRARMVEHDLDKKLLEKVVNLAKETGKFGWQSLKYTLDSSPLLGVGRVQDTWNLIGRALSIVVDCAAKCLAIPREKILEEAKLSLISGPSLKAALDIDWDDEQEKAKALRRLLSEVESLQTWISKNAKEESKQPLLQEALQSLVKVLEQDLEPDPSGKGMKIRKQVAPDRMPSLGDKEMRHGRKSKSKLFNGYKRHVATLASGSLIVAAAVLPANQPEHHAVDSLLEEAQKHGEAEGVLIDRGYLSSPRIATLPEQGKQVICKPWKTPNHNRFTKDVFKIDLPQRQVTCPAGVVAKFPPTGPTVRFPKRGCDICLMREKCISPKAARGRMLDIHPNEAMFIHLRIEQKKKQGRQALRERVKVEHSLAKLSSIQGNRARYKGVRRNTLDVRRCAAIINLQAIHRVKAGTQCAA